MWNFWHLYDGGIWCWSVVAFFPVLLLIHLSYSVPRRKISFGEHPKLVGYYAFIVIQYDRRRRACGKNDFGGFPVRCFNMCNRNRTCPQIHFHHILAFFMSSMMMGTCWKYAYVEFYRRLAFLPIGKSIFRIQTFEDMIEFGLFGCIMSVCVQICHSKDLEIARKMALSFAIKLGSLHRSGIILLSLKPSV